MEHYQSAHIWSLIPSIFGLVLLYVFQEQIDKTWWSKFPPLLDDKIKAWISVYSPFYQQLSPIDQKKFEGRLSQFMKLKDYTLKVEKDYQLEEDVKALLSHEYIRISFNNKNYHFQLFGHFVLYNHPFASPDYQFLHTIEVNQEDGVVILSKEQLINGFNPDNRQFNIGLYAAAICWLAQFPRLNYPEMTVIDIGDYCEQMGYSLESITQTTGLRRISKLALSIYSYTNDRVVLQEKYPAIASRLTDIFH